MCRLPQGCLTDNERFPRYCSLAFICGRGYNVRAQIPLYYIEVIRTFVTLDRKVILVEFAGISSFELLHFAFDFQLLTFNLFNQSAVSTRQIFFII